MPEASVSAPAVDAPAVAAPAVRSQATTLRRLYLTQFLRGKGLRLKANAAATKDQGVRSIGTKMAWTLLVYLGFGAFAFVFMGQPVAVLAVMLHSLTFLTVGMFVLGSAGEALFNREEAEILLHRPVPPGTILAAKIAVLVQVAVWLAGALNLFGLFVGARAPDGGLRFIGAHALSVVLEALFCASGVVVMYQLTVRWLGRERVESMLTIVQVATSVLFVLAAQIVPRLIRMDALRAARIDAWWAILVPPAWFAGVSDALGGSGSAASWRLAAVGVVATALLSWLAVRHLAGSYEDGMQAVAVRASRPTGGRRSVLDRVLSLAPLRLWLRDPVARASFRLTAAYLLRDRETKLRIYPQLASVLVIPIMFMLPGRRESAAMDGFGLAFAGTYLGLVPLTAIPLLQFSEGWRAAEVLRLAPLAGPAAIMHGTRRAVLALLVLPLLLVFVVISVALGGDATTFQLVLPGVLALPVYALIPSVQGTGLPLSRAADAPGSAGRTGSMLLMMFTSSLHAGLAWFAHRQGLFWWFMAVEAVIVVVLYRLLRAKADRAGWPDVD